MLTEEQQSEGSAELYAPTARGASERSLVVALYRRDVQLPRATVLRLDVHSQHTARHTDSFVKQYR